MSPKLHAGAVLYAKDVARVAAFYETVAGLSILENGRGHVILGTETFQLVVHGIPDGIAASIMIETPPVRRESTPIKLVFPVASLAEARAAAETLGGALNPRDREWSFQGMSVCDGHDPEGNVFQLREGER